MDGLVLQSLMHFIEIPVREIFLYSRYIRQLYAIIFHYKELQQISHIHTHTCIYYYYIYMCVRQTQAASQWTHQLSVLYNILMVFQVSLVYISRSIVYIIRGLCVIFFVCLFLVVFTPIGFPFSDKSGQRHIILVSSQGRRQQLVIT